MAKYTIKYKPLSLEEFAQLDGYHPLTDLSLNTGARISEIKRMVDLYKPGMTQIDILTKKSGKVSNRFYLNTKAQHCLEDLMVMKNVCVKTFSRKYKSISKEVGIKFSSHNLRATFITRLIILGVNLPAVQSLANHSDISMTAAYIQFDELYLRNALENLVEYSRLDGLTKEELLAENIQLKNRIAILEEYYLKLKKK